MHSDLIHYRMSRIWYKTILDMFGFDHSKDKEARDLLFSYFQKLNYTTPEPIISYLQSLIVDKIPLFIGAGPSLVPLLDKYSGIIRKKRQTYLVVAADGSALALYDYQIIPDIIFSDLDGLSYSDFCNLSEHSKIIFVVHAHGDNIEKIHDFFSNPLSLSLMIGTTQVEPRFPIINPGGFTDGDRSIVFFHHLYPRSITFHLVGYDFEGKVGKYSKKDFMNDHPMSLFKKKKMDVCKMILTFLSKEEDRTIIYNQFPEKA